MKQTPRIVIEPDVIERCFDCPYFEERSHGYDEEGKYCKHPKNGGWEHMNEYRFETIPGTEIWINCPLPDAVEEKLNGKVTKEIIPNQGI